MLSEHVMAFHGQAMVNPVAVTIILGRKNNNSRLIIKINCTIYTYF